MVSESEEEQGKEAHEPTQQELDVKASQDAGFSKTVDVRQNLQNETGTRCSWEKHSVIEFTRQRSVEGSMIVSNVPGRTKLGHVLDVFVSEEQGLMRIYM